MTIIAMARDAAPGAVARFRGLELHVGESIGLLPALPLRIRRRDHGWEPVGHAVDRPAQIDGLAGAPWSRLSRLRLHDDGDVLRLSGVAEPTGRRFELTAADPLGRWSAVRWPGSARGSSTRGVRAAQRPHPSEPEAPGLIAWHDFARGPLGDGWIGSEWPGAAWHRDETEGLLRPVGHPGTRFVGVEARHRELAIAARVRLPVAGSAGGGLEVHVGGEPRRIGVERTPDGTVRVVGSMGTIGALPAIAGVVDLALICGRTSIELEVTPSGGPTIHRTAHRCAGPVTAAGMYADAGDEPAGFAWFEYRGGRCAVANRAGGTR